MMKKIGVVANHKTINFGTMLQAYATQHALEQLGFQVETINLEGLEKDIKAAKMHFFRTQMSKKDVFESKIPTVKKMLHRKLDRSFSKQLDRREHAFRVFRENTFPMSRKCENREELTSLSKEYDTVLVGSDQIWLPSNIAADIFTLNFVPEEINKVAYASSFGVPMLPDTQRLAACSFLNRINYVSVREQSGQMIVREIAHREVPVVCDPTMLFTREQWLEMIPSHKLCDKPYIFCYFLGNNPGQRNFVKKVKEKTGLEIAAPLHMDDYIRGDNAFPDIALFDIGPEEFLNYIRHAQYVFTDSFHGTVLSILNGKSVFTFNRFKPGAAQSTNTRIDSLYSILGLHERHITENADTDFCIELPAQYAQAYANIDAFRADSWQYLKTALGVQRQ